MIIHPKCGDGRQRVKNYKMLGNQENTPGGGGANTKRRKQLVRQSAKTEPELESCDVDEAEGLERLGSPSQGRIIYKETIDISASPATISLPVSPPQSWMYGSNRYLATQYSGTSFNRSEV